MYGNKFKFTKEHCKACRYTVSSSGSTCYGIMYIPSQIIIPGDSVSTAKNIISNELLFRTGIFNDILSNIIFLFLVLVLYRMFRHVNENQELSLCLL